MRIVTNPGSNLDEDTTIGKDIDLTPQKIVVDGIPFDTRSTIDFAQVDGWVKRAHKHPQAQGTTEAEFLDHFSRHQEGPRAPLHHDLAQAHRLVRRRDRGREEAQAKR